MNNTNGYLTLSGRADWDERSVLVDDIQIGCVIKRASGLWMALDGDGRCHGMNWRSEWYAAKQMCHGLGIKIYD